ncbi:integrase [Sorangium sp. So ce887]|uniref:integrase n=1 Tax=Sorangium sp. So ce887 TaxID=3133324 RepID=UPI003F6085DB
MRSSTLNSNEVVRRCAELLRLFDDAELPENTRRLYGAQWRQFVAWCAARRSLPLPARPRLVVLYLASLAQERLAPSTIKAAGQAIAKAHELSGQAPPTSSPIVIAWRRRLVAGGAHEQRQAVPLTAEQIRQISASMDDDLVDLRDRALLLVGYAARLRRADLVRLNVADVRFAADELELVVPARRILLPRGCHPITCPVRAVRAWLDAAALPAHGPLFVGINRWDQLGDRLSDRAVGLIVQARAREAGLMIKGISADSLHVGPPDERRLL